MLAPMSWIKKFVDVKVDADKYIDDMIMTGSEVEGYTKQGAKINNVLIGKIVKLEQHSNADKLKVCQIDIGKEEYLQIVTGADNVFEGAYVPVATIGALLPNGLKINKSKLRGVESDGMLCSGAELKIDNTVIDGAEYDGILILKDEYKPGQDFCDAIGYNDVVIDFKTYANRPDTLSVMGLARETAATYNVKFIEPEYNFTESTKDTQDYIDVEIKDDDLCRRYIGKVVYDIDIKPSPKWMQKHLSAAGIRPINNIVDITNYVMLEVGQPLHAFDLKYVEGAKIIVRRAKDNEKITTLDGKEYNLTTENLVIADAKKPIALAGVMGGENSCIYDDTKMILFESANFNNFNIRRTSRQLGLRTESSARFEKGIQPEACITAINRAMHLVEQLGAGKIAKSERDVYKNQTKREKIIVDPNRINALLGQNIDTKEMKNVLERVFIKTVINGEMLECEVPDYRNDLETYADIAEEVMRIYGYDKIKSALPSNNLAGGRNIKQKRKLSIRNLLVSMGLFQTVTYSFMSSQELSKLNISQTDPLNNAVRIKNPIGEDYSLMRTTLVPAILANILLNKNHNNNDIKMFEINRTYIKKDEDANVLPDEVDTLCIGINSKTENFFTLKGYIEALLVSCGINSAEFSEKNINYLHPGRRAKITSGDTELGYMGELHPDAAENYHVQGKTLIAEINLDMLMRLYDDKKTVKLIPKFPAIQRDLALIMDINQTAGPIIDSIEKLGGTLLESVEIFDIYQGEQIEKGKKSVAFSLIFRAFDRTLTDDEVKKIFDNIVNKMEKNFGARLRM